MEEYEKMCMQMRWLNHFLGECWKLDWNQVVYDWVSSVVTSYRSEWRTMFRRESLEQKRLDTIRRYALCIVIQCDSLRNRPLT